MNKKKLKYVLVFLILIALIIIPMTYSKYIKKYTKQLTVNAIQPTYQVVFDSNGGEGTMPPQTLTYKTPAHLDPNEFTNGNYTFEKWNTKADGSGTDYEDEQEVNNLTSENGGVITLYAQWIDKVARIGNTYYETLADAIDDVYSSSPQTTIVLLKSVNENIIIPAGVDIILNLNRKTLSNDGNTNVIQNNGNLILKNGTVHSNASTNGAINNNSTGTIEIDGVTVTVDGTGNRQALYNDKGIATIKGGSVLTSVSTQRGAVQNVAGGTMTILDATIESTGFHGLVNASTLTLGDQNDEVKNTPVIIGKSNGINTSVDVNFYDGIIKGRTRAVSDDTKLKNIPEDYMIISEDEVIEGITYHTKRLGIGVTVTFNANGGSTTEASRTIEAGHTLGTMPSATKTGHTFDGWFTEAEDGEEVTGTTVINEDMIVFAHFTSLTDIASMNGTIYDSLQAAINAAPANTETTITLLKNTSEEIKVNNTRNLIIDLNNHTVSNYGSKPVITNNGTLTLMNGTISSNAAQGAINQESGVLNMFSGQVVINSDRQALYITGGVANIGGDVYMSSTATGTPDKVNLDRATIQCISGGTLNLTGGTIVSTTQHAISSNGIVNIGTKDGSIDATTPVLQGEMNGVLSIGGTLNIYDGIIKGKTATINGTVNEIEDNSHWVSGTEVIDSATYLTQYLELD